MHVVVTVRVFGIRRLRKKKNGTEAVPICCCIEMRPALECWKAAVGELHKLKLVFNNIRAIISSLVFTNSFGHQATKPMMVSQLQ